MHPGALRALEFDRIVAAVCAFAQTPMGAACLGQLEPATDPGMVARALSATAETVRFLTDGQINVQAPADLIEILGAASVEGRALEPLQLLALASFLASVERLRQVSAAPAGPFQTSAASPTPPRRFSARSPTFAKKIDPGGEVVDDASPELRSIRDRLRKQRARLRGTLESYLRGKDTAKYLQDQVVTDRNGRYVLVVRAEHRTAIPGHRARQFRRAARACFSSR